MAIKFELQVEKDILRITARGRDDNLKQVQEYGLAIMAAAIENNSNKVICNETELEYSLGTLDTFELAKTLAEVVPKVLKVALVCSPNQFHDASFWETVAFNRGAQVRVFKDMVSAEEWIA